MMLYHLVTVISTPGISLLLTGIIVGFVLSLTGSGGSVVCVPLLLYFVNMTDIYMVIGTSATAVAISACINLFTHALNGTVRWKKGALISLVAFAGALPGSWLARQVNGQYLLLPFSILMMIVALLMLKKAYYPPTQQPKKSQYFYATTRTFALLSVGVSAGFLGIGGGFLIVPLLVWLFQFSTVDAVTTSLMVVFATGISTSVSYALAGKVAPTATLIIIVGGFFGGFLGVQLASRLKQNERIMTLIFSVMLIAIALYMLIKNF